MYYTNHQLKFYAHSVTNGHRKEEIRDLEFTLIFRVTRCLHLLQGAVYQTDISTQTD